MQLKSKNFKGAARSLFMRVLTGCFAAHLLIYLSLGQSSVALIQNFDQEAGFIHEQPFIHLDNDVLTSSDRNSPSTLHDTIPGDSAETENEDKTEEDSPDGDIWSAGENQKGLNETWVSFLNLTTALQNREKVPLYILHHSWKNFLS